MVVCVCVCVCVCVLCVFSVICNWFCECDFNFQVKNDGRADIRSG